MLLKFTVKDQNANKFFKVHQAFVALVHGETRRELIYIAEPEATSNEAKYVFDLVCFLI